MNFITAYLKLINRNAINYYLFNSCIVTALIISLIRRFSFLTLNKNLQNVSLFYVFLKINFFSNFKFTVRNLV